MKKIAFIHFLPLEYYPPATNMINYLAEEMNSMFSLYVFSTHNTKKRKVFENKNVKIYRTSQVKENQNRLFRLFKYLNFQIIVLLKLIIYRPDKILYYETLSSFPVYLYKKFINRSSKIFIHYHEYTTPEQYHSNSMAIERFFHKLEQKYIYKKADWVSHTNKDRIKFFHDDNPFINKNILKEMPNYPPKSWLQNVYIDNNQESLTTPLKCVYIGSLSLKNTYVQEFIEWIIIQNGDVTFDIYAYNIDLETKSYIDSKQYEYVNFFDNGVEYNNIPLILKKYDVGIIFYKPNSDNIINCVSNKFYEYYACGLDIWFSDIMNSTMQYVSYKNTPRVIPVDFKNIKTFNSKVLRSNETLIKSPLSFFCNNIYSEIKESLTV